ncbi:MAG: hypothetical protein AAFQ98_27225, partial [Bacteroidota bacterium]
MMKQVLWLMTAGLLWCDYTSANTVTPLSEAIEKGVKVEFRAMGETADNVSSYYGVCMQVRVHNESDTTLRLQLEPGLYLIPD